MTNHEEPDTLLRVTDVARRVGVSHGVVTYHRSLGHLPEGRYFGRILFFNSQEVKAIESYFARRERYARTK